MAQTPQQIVDELTALQTSTDTAITKIIADVKGLIVAPAPTPTPTPTPTPIPTPAPIVESPNGTSINSIAGFFYDNKLRKISLKAAADPTLGLQIAVDGIVDPTNYTANVLIVGIWSHLTCHQASNANALGINPGWWSTTDYITWTDIADPRGTITPIPTPTPTPAPISGGFTIGPATAMPTSGAININLTAPTPLSVSQELFGVSQSSNNSSWNASFGDSTWVATMAALDVRSWRLQGEHLMDGIFPSANSASGANFAVLDPMVNNINKAFPNAKKMWTIVDAGMSPGYSNCSPAVFTSQVMQVLNYLESRGVHMDYIDPYNEPNGGSASSAQCKAVSASLYPALAALGKGYKFGTAPATEPIVPPYPSDAIAGYPAMDYISGHWYAGAAEDSGGASGDLVLGTHTDGSGNLNWGPFYGLNIADETYNGKKYPFALSEYGLGYGGGGVLNANSTNMIATCSYAELLANGAKSNLIWQAAVWDGAQAVYGWTGRPATLAPHCYMLAKAGQIMPGRIVAANTNLPLTLLATTGGIMVINNNATAAQNNQPVAIAGLLNTTLHKWQQSATDSSGNFSNNAGVTTTITAAALASQSFPPLSVTIYSK